MAFLERYRTQMIPKAQQVYDLCVRGFRHMAAAYLQVLIAPRNLFPIAGGRPCRAAESVADLVEVEVC
jgi:hypothetical protein